MKLFLRVFCKRFMYYGGEGQSEGEIEGERIPSRLRAVSTEPDVGLDPWSFVFLTAIDSFLLFKQVPHLMESLPYGVISVSLPESSQRYRKIITYLLCPLSLPELPLQPGSPGFWEFWACGASQKLHVHGDRCTSSEHTCAPLSHWVLLTKHKFKPIIRRSK